MVRLSFLLLAIQVSVGSADDSLSKLFCDTAVEQQAQRRESAKHSLKAIAKKVQDISNPRNVQFGSENTELQVAVYENNERVWKLRTRDRRTQREEIERLKAEYAALKSESQKPFKAPLLELSEMRVGSIGFPVVGGEPSSLAVTQVLSPRRVLIKWGDNGFIFEGQDFSGVVDGQRVQPTTICVVESTETFETVIGGTRTVFVMRALSKQEIEQAMEYLRANAPSPPSKFRNWTDASGAYSIEAEFVSSSRGIVTLRKEDGTEISLPLSKLSDDDRDYAKEHADPW